MALIGVVDCNNFFVSCERLFRPDLEGKPVAVLSSNDGCFVARSQEVKDMGIPMGVPYFKVKDIVKDNEITLFSSHFALYRDVSRRVFKLLDELLDDVEQYSVDEAFFVAPEETDPTSLAAKIKSEIELQIGIPVSVGIAHSKTQAKYAVGVAKRTTGIKILESDEWEELKPEIKLSELWGVGGKSAVKYRKEGYETVSDLLQADQARVKKLFGVVGERLVAELKGERRHKALSQKAEQKSMMSTRSFKDVAENILILEDAVAYHTRHIAANLRKQNQLASVVRVSIRPGRHGDFALQGSFREAILPQPTNDTFALLKVTQKLLKEAYKTGVPYKKAGVSVGHMVPADMIQQTLFRTGAGANNKLLDVVDFINKKSGSELISIGDRRRGSSWQARKDMVSPAYTTKWGDVAVVKA